MFTNAGMNQFKDIFTGKRQAEFPRVVTVQKCMRAGGKHNDLENVGRTSRHHTFFEMLGNFSFGDYFKEEAIKYAWEWISKWLELPIERLYVSVYREDDEAFKLWEKIAPPLKGGRILRFDKKDNYWSMGDYGPNGPSSEIHYDRGEKYGVGPEHTVNGETERFAEIWNLVFMQYNNKPDGTIEPLPQPSVDTGAGLERMACVLQDTPSTFEIDITLGIIEHICDLTGKKYYSDERGVSHRIIADHIRALTFCIADGGGLSNEKQGYVLRRILRRAARHGRLLDMHEPFIYKLVPTLISIMGDAYPEIISAGEHIRNVIRSEEESFGRTLDTGLELFENIARKIKSTGGKILPGGEVFRLYDTYGFPVDLTQIIAGEHGLRLDMEGFERMMHKQQAQSRAGSQSATDSKEQLQVVLHEIVGQLPSENLITEFVRNDFEIEGKVLEIFELSDGHDKLLAVIPDRTPFYVEAGGQTADQGYISCDHFQIRVNQIIKHRQAIIHVGPVTEKKYRDIENLGDIKVKLHLDEKRRWDIMRNHTATHLLHAALRKVLGQHVHQSGSYVGPDKLRFDFSHFQPMSPEEITEVEKNVNEFVLSGAPVEAIEEELEKAKKSGAMAIFGEKYESRVRVVSISDFSKELCGGTHVTNVAQIGSFLITMETGVASGIRRIEAITGREAADAIIRYKSWLEKIGRTINQPPELVADGIEEMFGKFLELQKENKKLKAEKFTAGNVSIGQEIQLGNVTLRFHDFGEAEAEEMAGWIDSGKDANYPLMSVGVGLLNGKRTYMSSASKSAGIDVGYISKQILDELGGKGGGKSNFARGSIPMELKSDDIFKKVREKIKENSK